MWSLQNKDKENSDRFKAMFNGMKNARKLFRLFKSVNEYQKLSQMLKEASDDDFAFLLNILGFFFYWIFDNLNILGAIKFLNVDNKKHALNGARCWFFALVMALILNVRNLIKISHKQIAIEKELAKCDESQAQLR